MLIPWRGNKKSHHQNRCVSNVGNAALPGDGQLRQHPRDFDGTFGRRKVERTWHGRHLVFPQPRFGSFGSHILIPGFYVFFSFRKFWRSFEGPVVFRFYIGLIGLAAGTFFSHGNFPFCRVGVGRKRAGKSAEIFHWIFQHGEMVDYPP